MHSIHRKVKEFAFHVIQIGCEVYPATCPVGTELFSDDTFIGA
jgi:hypothetical protein